jgi:hypothetical protein
MCSSLIRIPNSVVLAWSYEPVSYGGGGSVATSRVCHAAQVKGDDPDNKAYHGLPDWGLSVGFTIPPRKKP